MQATPSSPRPTQPDDPALPAEWLRTTISFLLFLHLFALVVAVISNWNPSPLASRLREVPLLKPYLEYLAMDQSYLPLYSLTFGVEQDTDNTVEIDLKLADGSQRQFVLPDSAIGPRQRWRRDLRLAETTADLTGEDYRNVESILPQAIAAHFVARYQGKSGTIRCRRHFLQPMEALSSSVDSERDPYDKSRYTELYAASIIVVGDQVQLLKSEAAADVAPAAVEEGKP